MPELTPHDTTVAVSPSAAGSRPWRRHRYVVDARYQLRAGVLVGVVAVILLGLLNLSLIVQYRAGAAVAGLDRVSWALVLVGSVVFLGGVILVGVLESHRTAGAAYAIRTAVDAIREGRSEIRVRLRRDDHLQDLANAINRLAETIDAERGRRG